MIITILKIMFNTKEHILLADTSINKSLIHKCLTSIVTEVHIMTH